MPQTPQTVPMFSPDGTLGDVPYEKMIEARNAGAIPAVEMLSPDGSRGFVPAPKVADATRAGGKPVPIEHQEVKQAGFWQAVGEDAGAMGKALIFAGPFAMGYQGARHSIDEVKNALATGKTLEQSALERRRAAGYSTPYGVTAGVAEQLGVNVEGMEQAAREGQSSQILGHTVTPAAAAVAPLAIEAGTRAAGATARAVKRVAQPVLDTRAQKAVTSLIKPSLNDVRFGKDPAGAVIREGIVAGDLPELGDKVYNRAREVGRQIDLTLNTPDAATKRVDIRPALEPVDQAMQKAVAAGDRPLYEKLKAFRDQVTQVWQEDPEAGTIAPVGARNLESISPLEATRIKRQVGDMTRWTGTDPMEHEVNGVKGAVFGRIKSIVNDAVPEVQELNSRYADLVSAGKAIERRSPVAARNADFSLSDIAAAGGALHYGGPVAAGTVLLKKVAGTTYAKTRAAQLISSEAGKFAGDFPQVPQAQPRAAAAALPAGPVMAQASTLESPTSAAPFVDATTRAQRKGLTLPERAGGRIPLPAAEQAGTIEGRPAFDPAAHYEAYRRMTADNPTGYPVSISGVEIQKVSSIPKPSDMNIPAGRKIHAELVMRDGKPEIRVLAGLSPQEFEQAIRHEFEQHINQPASAPQNAQGYRAEYPEMTRPATETGPERAAAPQTPQTPTTTPEAPQTGSQTVTVQIPLDKVMERIGGVRKTGPAGSVQGANPATVEELRQKFAAAGSWPDDVPPIKIQLDPMGNIIGADGRHRLTAARQAFGGRAVVPVEIERQLEPERATMPARRANAKPPGRRETARAAVSGPDEPNAPAQNGADTAIKVPGEDRAYQARYQVRELTDVKASHSGLTFNPNEKYLLTNDRDYANGANQGKVINAAGGRFDPAYHITDNPDATNGPVVIDSTGHALGGNGRAMILERVYRYNPEGAEAYRKALEAKAAQFGIDPATIKGMKRPVLVREIPDSEFQDAREKQIAVTDFNKKGTAEMTPAERAIADSKRMSSATLDEVAGRLEDKGPDASLADVLRDPNAADIIDRLIKDGVISPQERAAYANKGALTEAGKERIQKLIVGRFFRDPAQVDTTQPAIKIKLEKLAAPLAKLESRPGWNLTPAVQEAVDIVEEMRAHNTANVDDLLSQSSMFGQSAKYSPEALALARHLKSSSARQLLELARAYQGAANDAARPMFSDQAISPAQAFDETFGHKPKK